MAIARRTGDRYGEGAAESNLCVTDLARGDLKAGIACYEGALPVLREVQAAALEGSALTSAGRAYDILGEPDQARERPAAGARTAARSRSAQRQARTLNYIGLLSQEVEDSQDALARFGLGARRLRRPGRPAAAAGTVLHNTGLVYQSLGEWPRAASSYEAALRLRRAVGDRPEEAATLTNLGIVGGGYGRPRGARPPAARLSCGGRRRDGRARRADSAGAPPRASATTSALADFDRAVELLHAAGSRADEADALRNRGDAWLARGDGEKARASLEEALRLAQEEAATDGERRPALAGGGGARRRARKRGAGAPLPPPSTSSRPCAQGSAARTCAPPSRPSSTGPTS